MTPSFDNSQGRRDIRASLGPIVPEFPGYIPGIRAAMELSPELQKHLTGLADTLLVQPFPGSSLSRVEAELVATGVSAANSCFFCMDSHAAHATAVAEHTEPGAGVDIDEIAEALKAGHTELLSDKMKRLMTVALNVRDMTGDHEKEKRDVQAALEAGALPGDINHTIAIAAAFSMFNRLVEGFWASTPGNVEIYAGRAAIIAVDGYGTPSPRPQ